MHYFKPGQRVYQTPLGTQVTGDSLSLLEQMPDESVDLIITSPPFALQRKKAYGNEEQDVYVEWLARFGEAAKRVLKDTGSLVIDIGNAYRRGSPTRSLYPYRVLIKFVDELGYFLAEEFFWYNPAKLPAPAEWVNKRRIRVKDAVNTVWWFSKTEWPHADVNQVLLPYSDNMRRLLKNPEKYYKPGERPSEHDISANFGRDNGGSIPANLLQIPNTNSSSYYLRTCRDLGVRSHPARFPEKLPEFFIKFLTKPGDLVVDLFSGSNTTGVVAEQLGRRWLAFELSRDYAALSILRFIPGVGTPDAGKLYEKAHTRTIRLPEEGRPDLQARVEETVDAAELVEVELEKARAAVSEIRARLSRSTTSPEELQKAKEDLPAAVEARDKALVTSRAATRSALAAVADLAQFDDLYAASKQQDPASDVGVSE